jgi:hypothetical protein
LDQVAILEQLSRFSGQGSNAQPGVANPNAQEHSAPSPAEAAPAKAPASLRFGDLRGKLFASLPGAFREGRRPTPPEPGRKESRPGNEGG